MGDIRNGTLFIAFSIVQLKNLLDIIRSALALHEIVYCQGGITVLLPATANFTVCPEGLGILWRGKRLDKGHRLNAKLKRARKGEDQDHAFTQ